MVRLATVLLALPVCAQQAAPPRDTSPQILDVQGGNIRVVTVANGLFHPWGIAFADANTILVTEKNGALRMIRNGVLDPQPVWTSPTPAGQGDDSLHFVAVHPKFADNQLVYVCIRSRARRDPRSPWRGDISKATARRRRRDLRRRRVGDRWQHRRPRLLRPGRHALRDHRRSRSHLLQRAQSIRTDRMTTACA